MRAERNFVAIPISTFSIASVINGHGDITGRCPLYSIETRVRDKLKVRTGGGPGPATTGHPVVSDAEISAFAQVASDDPAAKQLFCRD